MGGNNHPPSEPCCLTITLPQAGQALGRVPECFKFLNASKKELIGDFARYIFQ
jgi:hypothetical protein